MDTIKEKYHSLELPLITVTAVDRTLSAKHRLSWGEGIIRSPEGMHEGVVLHRLPEEYDETIGSLSPGDIVVCRTNAPLVKPCMQ
jgi:hypothetical protein